MGVGLKEKQTRRNARVTGNNVIKVAEKGDVKVKDLIDLSWATEELYEKLHIDCYDIYRAMIDKLTDEIIVLITYPTDVLGTEVIVESNDKDVKKEVIAILKDEPENLEKVYDRLKEKYGNVKIYDISEYDEAYIIRIEK